MLASLDAVAQVDCVRRRRRAGARVPRDRRARRGRDRPAHPARPGARPRGRVVRRRAARVASAVGERAPFDAPAGADWLDGFGGGLIATCGLRNVGLASEGHGLHGRISHVRARRRRRERALAGGEAVVTISGVLDEVSSLGPAPAARADHHDAHGRRRRRADRPCHQPRRGARARAAALPRQPRRAAARTGAARVEIEGTRPEPRDDPASRAGWEGGPRPAGRWRARTRSCSSTCVASDSRGPGGRRARGEPGARARGHGLVGSRRAASPVAVDPPRAGVYALGLEPANCSVLGRAADRAAGRLPVLEPGAERVTRVRVQAAPC